MTTLTLVRTRRPAPALPSAGMAVLTVGLLLAVLLYAAVALLLGSALWSALA